MNQPNPLSQHGQTHRAARVGLISDTHMPDRCLEIPAALDAVFAGVDLILHAGDVGELWVLDRLAQIAPVVAVHGNDETEDAQRELPYQQLVNVSGQRILLWHSHYPDRVDEMASRRSDEIIPKLMRSVERAKRADAGIAIFGHWHIPLVYEHDGVLVINPGALAAGNAFSRQRYQTVALLDLQPDAPPQVTHVDLAQPDRTFDVPIAWEAGFKAALAQFSASILTPELAADVPRLRQLALERIPRAEHLPLWSAIVRAAQPCWAGDADVVSHADWLAAINAAPDISPEVKKEVVALLRSA